ARPIITAFTTTSADMNIDHGDNSRGTLRAGLTDADSAMATVGVAAAGAAWAIAAGGAADCAVVGWSDVGCCWDSAGEASMIAATAANFRTVLNMRPQSIPRVSRSEAGKKH